MLKFISLIRKDVKETTEAGAERVNEVEPVIGWEVTLSRRWQGHR